MFLTQLNNPFQNPNMMIYLMYGGLTLYFLYKFYKGFQERKHAEGETFGFGKNVNKLMMFLGVLIIGFGGFNIFKGDVISGLLMLALVVALFLEYNSKNIFAENGFIADSKFVEWNNLRKWAFDAEKGELVVRYKDGFDEKTGYIRVKPEDIEEIDQIIRRFKLKK